AAQILYRVRATVAQPVLVKLGAFRSPRALHETATKLAPWTNGFVLVHGVYRRVLDERGNPAFEGSGRESANVVGPDIFSIASPPSETSVPGIVAPATPARAARMLRYGPCAG